MTFVSSSSGSSNSFDSDTRFTPSESSNSPNQSLQHQYEFDCDLDPITTARFSNLLSSCTCQKRCYWKEGHNQWVMWLRTVDKMNTKTLKFHAIDLITPSLIHQQSHVHPTYQLPFIGTVCRNFFRVFWHLGNKQLYTLAKNISNSRSIECYPHGNSNKHSYNQLPEQTKLRVLHYLANLKRDHGESIATRSYKQRTVKGSIITRIEVFFKHILYALNCF